MGWSLPVSHLPHYCTSSPLSSRQQVYRPNNPPNSLRLLYRRRYCLCGQAQNFFEAGQFSPFFSLDVVHFLSHVCFLFSIALFSALATPHCLLLVRDYSPRPYTVQLWSHFSSPCMVAPYVRQNLCANHMISFFSFLA